MFRVASLSFASLAVITTAVGEAGALNFPVLVSKSPWPELRAKRYGVEPPVTFSARSVPTSTAKLSDANFGPPAAAGLPLVRTCNLELHAAKIKMTTNLNAKSKILIRLFAGYNILFCCVYIIHTSFPENICEGSFT